MSSKTIKFVDNKYLYFGKDKIDILTKTGWIKNVKNTKDKPEQYTLGDIWLFCDYKVVRKEKNADYQKKVDSQNQLLKMVSANDQRDMENYFKGNINSSQSINQELIQDNKYKGDYQGKRQKSSGGWVNIQFYHLD